MARCAVLVARCAVVTTRTAVPTLRALAATAALLATPRGSVAALTALAAFVARLVAITAALEHLEVLGRDLLAQVQRAAVVEVGAFFPGVHGEHLQDRVLARRATSGLASVLGREREVQEATASAAQAVLLGALQVARVDADVQELRRLAGLARLDRDRVAVQRADLRAAQLVARTVAAFDGGEHIGGLHGLSEPLAERADHVVELSEAFLVELEVELLRLVAEHVGERAGDAFDQGRVRHARGRGERGHSRDSWRRPGPT